MVSNEFKANVAQGNADLVKSALTDYLIIDHSFSKFDEALKYATSSLSIIQNHDNTILALVEDRSLWDETYLNKQLASLMMNFSIERVNHLKSVINKVLDGKSSGTNSVVSIGASTLTSGSVSKTSAAGSGRTGRRVISEVAVTSENNQQSTQTIKKTVITNRSQSSAHTASSHSATSPTPRSQGRTGRQIVSESETDASCPVRQTKSVDLGTALVVGGATIAAAGVFTAKVAIIGSGIVIAGAGCAVKYKNRT